MAFSLMFGKLLRLTPTLLTRRSSSTVKKGLVLGYYSEDGKVGPQLTPAAEKFNQISNGKLVDSLDLAGGELKEGKSYVFWGLDKEFRGVAVVCLGKPNKGYDAIERVDQDKEAVRIAASSGCKALVDAGIEEIHVEDLGDSESAAEGGVLSTWKFQEYKTKKEAVPTVQPYALGGVQTYWDRGAIKARAQNLARRLADTPSNLMTPTIFAEDAANTLANLGVQVEVHDEKWAEAQKMYSYLSVTKGCNEPAKFLELTYNSSGNNSPPCVLVGKGVTFDSGGISLKPAASMDEMRADMSGAACLVGVLKAAADLKLRTNLKVLIPLTENMPSGSATKPGDVVTAMNGKTICIDNTDAEGRLILADALCYSKRFNPRWVLDIATLTGAMRVALGATATGVFTNSNVLYEFMEKAGSVTGDRVWRMPLWKAYTKLITDYPAYDVNNVGKGKGGGGSCTAAAFLKEFAPENVDWLHLDIAGVMGPTDPTPYLAAGMTGRPTRTLIQFIASQLNTNDDERSRGKHNGSARRPHVGDH